MDTVVTEETRKDWEREQNEMKEKLVCDNTEEWQSASYEGLQYVGGVDISFVKSSNTQACASLVVCNYPELEVLYEDCSMIELTAPYISGFLAFREVGFFLKLLDKLRNNQPLLVPQVIMVDGNGILHPRGFGTASHLGVLSGIPCIGVAKKLMQVDGLEKNEKHAAKIDALTKGGDCFPLIGDSGKILGKALRSCDKSSNPIYVSVGHKINIDTAVDLTHGCSLYRIPEPIRQADIRSREFLRLNVPEAQQVAKNTNGNTISSLHLKQIVFKGFVVCVIPLLILIVYMLVVQLITSWQAL